MLNNINELSNNNIQKPLIAYLIVTALLDATTALIITIPILIYIVIKYRSKVIPVIPGLTFYIAVIALGAIMGLPSLGTRDYIRDFFYIINPIIYILLGGYFSYIYNNNDLKRSIVICGAILSIIHLIRILESNSATSFDVYRSSFISSYIIPYSLCILIIDYLFNDKKNRCFKPLTTSIFTIIISLDQILSFSRINIIIILFIISLVEIKKDKFSSILGRFFQITLICLFLFIFLSLINIPFFSRFMNKLANSISEVSSTEVWTEEEITENWRGYEIASSQRQFSQSSTINKLLGSGFGARIHVGSIAHLVTDDYQNGISILHNTYYFILIKYGLVGLILYIIFYLCCILRVNRSFSRNSLLKLSSLYLIVSVLFISYISNHFSTTNALFVWLSIGYFSQSVRSYND